MITNDEKGLTEGELPDESGVCPDVHGLFLPRIAAKAGLAEAEASLAKAKEMSDRFWEGEGDPRMREAIEELRASALALRDLCAAWLRAHPEGGAGPGRQAFEAEGPERQ